MIIAFATVHNLTSPGQRCKTRIKQSNLQPTAPKMRSYLTCLCLIFVSCSLLADDYQPELFQSTKLIYEDDFSSGKIDTNYWQTRQGSTWIIKDGVLVGSPSPKEFQDKTIAAGDKAHAGFKPVMWMEKMPENLVVHFRVKFDARDYHPKFPLIDVGHHVNTLTFAKGSTKLTLKKGKKIIPLKDLALPLHTWVNVTMELKKGAFLVKIGDQKTIIKDPLIDMVDQQQIDFKGVDHGSISIDDVKIYEGVN